MIGQIRGTILEKQPPLLLVEANGIGYEMDAPMSTFYQLPDVGQTVTLLTHFVVREDAHHLYAFYTRDERLLFRALLKVNGIGPRLALTILSSTTPDQFVHCVLNNDTNSLVKLPGIGKKTAERLVIEMRDKLSDWCTTSAAEGALVVKGGSDKRHHTLQDAISALVALGYKQQDANRTVTKMDDGAASSEELIRRALRVM
ncbi:MAG: Holliday junction DNA helicase RuvA [Gammaproteobacteria bacterium RIFCSPHIGHO2_12_FULL_37_34]|nr:MAG: Holliday junction DNA helicase RuvA [Gammaproteobacteria bacterium RIFCSPHIGHO2_12_FULL_37_34]